MSIMWNTTNDGLPMNNIEVEIKYHNGETDIGFMFDDGDGRQWETSTGCSSLSPIDCEIVAWRPIGRSY